MKGILFKPEMRKAIIDLRKTQTRRLEASLARVNEQPELWECHEAVRDVPPLVRRGDWLFNKKDEQWKSIRLRPRYLPNETVYVKEAWAAEKQYDSLAPRDIPASAPIHYIADGVGEWPLHLAIGKLRSSMFLRECHARDFITFSRVIPQRLWDITEEDALAEGIVVMSGTHQPFKKGRDGKLHLIGKPEPYTAVYHYSALWDEINEHRGHPWSKNEWVFSYTFKLVPRPETY